MKKIINILIILLVLATVIHTGYHKQNLRQRAPIGIIPLLPAVVRKSILII